MRDAIAVGEYCLAHAAHAYDVMIESPAQSIAKALLEWVQKRNGEPFTLQNIRSGPRDIRRLERNDLLAGLAELVERGYLQRDGIQWTPRAVK
jgi:hypothetical protein